MCLTALHLLADGTPLKAWLAAAPQERLGPAVAARFGGDLPFLLKILSVAKALSIQAHPDIQLAQKLHAERPDVYKVRQRGDAFGKWIGTWLTRTHAQDGNHKPEMALAITTFEVRARTSSSCCFLHALTVDWLGAGQAMVGFVSPTQLAAAVTTVPELRTAVRAPVSRSYQPHTLGGLTSITPGGRHAR